MFNSERIEPASKRTPAMNAASRTVERHACAAVAKLQNRPATNRKAIDRLARRHSCRACQPQHIVRRQRDDLLMAAKPASVADIREWALTIHRLRLGCHKRRTTQKVSRRAFVM